MVIQFDTNDLIEKFYLNEDQVKNLIDFSIKELTASFAREWEKTANQKLGSSRNEYIQSLIVVDEGYAKGAVLLRGWLPNAVESGLEPFDEKCIVNKKTPIFTNKGWVAIKDIKIGDLVLTHTGKFNRVLKTFKHKVEKEDKIFKISFKHKGRSISKNITVTGNHPILTNRGWVKAESLMPEDKIIVTAERCRNCNKIFSINYVDEKRNIYCSKSCAAKVNNKFRREFGRIDLSKEARQSISIKRAAINKEAARLGKHPAQKGNGLYKTIQKYKENGIGWGFQRKEIYSDEKMMSIQHDAAVGLGKKSKFSDPESKIWPYLEQLGFIRQHLFKRDEMKKNKYGNFSNKWYFFDFALVEKRICVEINGERYHTKEQDNLKRIEVEGKGWTYLSFWSKEIYNNLENCIDQIKNVLRNHNGNFYFTETSFSIKRIIPKRFDSFHKYKYNLSVDIDNSFIANGLVVHNSGLLNGPNAKTGKNGGKYNTIPFKFGTPGSNANSFSGGIIPQEIHQIAKSKKPDQPIKKEELPSKYQEVKTVTIKQPQAKNFEQYTHKAAIYEGMVKKKDTVTGQNTYMSFRRVSENSDANSWQHPGIEARNLAEETLSNFDVPQEVGKGIDAYLKSIGWQ